MAGKRGNPAMQRGKPSLNPSGRPKGWKGLAAAIRKETKDGQELIDFALSVMRGQKPKGVHKDPSLQIRFDAMKWLADRGFGQAAQILNLEVEDNRFPDLDLTLLTDGEKDQLEALLDRATGNAVKNLPGKVLEGVLADDS